MIGGCAVTAAAPPRARTLLGRPELVVRHLATLLVVLHDAVRSLVLAAAREEVAAVGDVEEVTEPTAPGAQIIARGRYTYDDDEDDEDDRVSGRLRPREVARVDGASRTQLSLLDGDLGRLLLHRHVESNASPSNTKTLTLTKRDGERARETGFNKKQIDRVVVELVSVDGVRVCVSERANKRMALSLLHHHLCPRALAPSLPHAPHQGASGTLSPWRRAAHSSRCS